MLSCEFTVADGPHKGRKVWEYFILEGTTDGHARSADINRGTIKSILDSAFGIKPDDKGLQARAARTKRLGELEGLIFIARIGIEKGKAKPDGSGNWPDKNILAGVITSDRKEWHPLDQQTLPLDGKHGAQNDQAAQPDQPALPRPDWAF
jgi:hypothetical protein